MTGSTEWGPRRLTTRLARGSEGQRVAAPSFIYTGQSGANTASVFPPPIPIPLTAAVGAMFGLSTCVSAQVREKPDDPLNYFIGGCAGGLTLGANRNNYDELVQGQHKRLAAKSY